jgi:hypothetical protein
VAGRGVDVAPGGSLGALRIETSTRGRSDVMRSGGASTPLRQAAPVVAGSQRIRGGRSNWEGHPRRCNSRIRSYLTLRRTADGILWAWIYKLTYPAD